MGAFDDLDDRSPTRNMLGRALLEARRRIVLLIFITFFLLLTLVAFRKQDDLKDVVNTSLHRANTTSHTASTGSDTKASPGSDSKSGTSTTDSMAAGKSDSKADTKADTKSSKTSIWGGKKAPSQGPKLGNGDRTLAASSIEDIHNSTLGFENIFVINMPARSDKLDAMKLTASLTDFDFDIIDGINGNDVPKKALSGVWNQGDGYAGRVGCWRGHMEFAGHVARNRMATALVMEDDADWDIDLRHQLEYIALGAQTLQNTPTTSTPTSPYGDDWDLIWLGHCAQFPFANDTRRFLMHNDATVTPPTHRTNYGNVIDMTPYDATTRVMFWSQGGTCTYAYALSLHGARKMLKYLSMDIYSGPIDFGLNDMCGKPERGFKCIGVFPQIIADHKPAGAGNKDTDIGDGGESVREHGFSYNIVKSTRINVDALTDGDLERVVSQWPEDDPHVEGPIVTEFVTEMPEMERQRAPGPTEED